MNKYKRYKNSVDWRNTLSRKDKAAYLIIYVSLYFLMVFSLFSYLSIKSVIAFRDESTLAMASATADTWYIAPFCFLILGTMIYTDINYRRQDVVLFKGKSDNIKHHTSKKEHIVKKEKTRKNKKIFIIFLSVIICLAVSFFGLFSRTVMDKNGTVHIYNFFSKTTSSLTEDDVQSLNIAAEKYTMRRNDGTDLRITVNYQNGKSYIFNIDSFIGSNSYSSCTDSLKGLIKIKELMKNKPVTISGRENLTEVAEYFEFSEADKKLLDELFEIT